MCAVMLLHGEDVARVVFVASGSVVSCVLQMVDKWQTLPGRRERVNA